MPGEPRGRLRVSGLPLACQGGWLTGRCGPQRAFQGAVCWEWLSGRSWGNKQGQAGCLLAPWLEVRVPLPGGRWKMGSAAHCAILP